MKIIVALVFVSFFTADVCSQSCRFTLERADPYTGDIEQRIMLMTFLNPYFNLGFYHKGEDYRLEAHISIPGKQLFELPPGNKIYILLGDSSSFTLENASVAKPCRNTEEAELMTKYVMSYPISKKQLEQIVRTGISFIRTGLNGQRYYDYNFVKRDFEKSKSDAECILKK